MFGTAARSALLVLCSACASVWPAAAVAQPMARVVLKDDLAREVSVARYPLRVIAMLPSLTETVCALGACDRLVAVDRNSNWPDAVRALPKVGGLDDAEIELIVSLKPDLVLISASQRITARLDELKLAAFALHTETYADALHAVTTIGTLLGLSARAAALHAAIQARVNEIAARTASSRRGAPPVVYFEVDRTPYAAGPASFIGEMLARLGARNIVPPQLGAFPLLNPEYVVRHDPDVIFVRGSDAQDLAARPGWDQLRAVRERRICSFPAGAYDTIVRAGPRIADGMQAMADCLTRMSP